MIRLFRTGRKNQPSYKVVVTEKTNASARGRFVEEVGFYNPLTKDKKFNAERIKYWISVGAQPSDTIHNMLVKEKIIEAALIPKHGKAKKKKEEESVAQTPEQPKEESEVKIEKAPATEEKKAEPEIKEKVPEAEKPAEEPIPEPEAKEESKAEEPPKEEKTEE
ncbi:MAG: 30S ribosomal protein S16 [Patescibacteria group bacterium]|nr:30S ribosomal protein S16 [Patescibacteria group bacterium]